MISLVIFREQRVTLTILNPHQWGEFNKVDTQHLTKHVKSLTIFILNKYLRCPTGNIFYYKICKINTKQDTINKYDTTSPRA